MANGPHRPPNVVAPRERDATMARAFASGNDADVRRLAGLGVGREFLDALAGGTPMLVVDGLVAGYGRMEVLHGIDLRVARGQALCLIGPNGAGKSTVLNAIYGLTRIHAGHIRIDGEDVTGLGAWDKLRRAGIAYVLQDSSVFPDMTVEENLWLGGYLMERPARAKEAAERIFERNPRLAARRREPARVLSGGERRVLEISRALMLDPRILLIDEPSIGLEPRAIAEVFELLAGLRDRDGRTIVLVEQNALRGLEFADIGYVLVAGEIAMAGSGHALLQDAEVGKLFLGG